MTNKLPSQPESREQLPCAEGNQGAQATDYGKPRFTIEKVMLMLALAYVLGIAAITFAPQEYDGLAIGGVIILCLLAMYKMN